MKLKSFISGLCLSLAMNALAAGHFDQVGMVDSFRWAPERYNNDFKYDIFYYVPKSLKTKEKSGALIFTHGGGGSTMDRQGSINTVKMYMPDLKRMADELGIIVVLPSANGLNWGGHTRGLMKELARLMRKELSIDVNRLGVSGHSMGGMGITRNYLWTADEFAFYLPMAAGMDVNHQSEQHLNKVFNVPYVHLQGLYDHFDIFVTRTEEQLKRTQDLEVKYGVPSKLKAVFYPGSHNYDYQLFKSHLKDLLVNTPRNLYQKELWGSLHTVQRTIVENNITFDYDSEARYFWVEAIDSDLSEQERIDFHARIMNNTIHIDMPVLPKRSKGLKLYLHSAMLDLNQEIDVVLNGKVVASRKGKPGVLRNMDPHDAGFNFEDTISVKF